MRISKVISPKARKSKIDRAESKATGSQPKAKAKAAKPKAKASTYKPEAKYVNQRAARIKAARQADLRAIAAKKAKSKK